MASIGVRVGLLLLQLTIIGAAALSSPAADASADHVHGHASEQSVPSSPTEASTNDPLTAVQRQLAEMRDQNERVNRQLAEMQAEMQRLKLKDALRHVPASGELERERTAAKASAELEAKANADPEWQRREAEAAHREREAGIQRVRESLQGRYIVGLHEHATEEHAEAVREHMRARARAMHGTDEGHVAVHRSFSHAMRGFAARLTLEVKAELEKHEHVKYIAEDRLVFPSQYMIPTSVTPIADLSSSGMSPQPWNASVVWHLDRLDQSTGGMSLDGHFDRGTVDGSNVDIYVVDTGVYESHPEIAGRTTMLFDVNGATAGDCSAELHGTAVASVAAGSTVGAAPGATIFGLNVFGRSSAGACLPATSDSLVIAGIDAVIASIRTRGRKAVVLLGLASSVVSSGTLLKANPAYTDAFSRLHASDVDAVVVTAAGNEYANACDATPGNSNGTINVGASDQDDYRAGFSNAGSCVTIFAPGQNIRAAALKTPYTFPAYSASFTTTHSNSQNYQSSEYAYYTSTPPYMPSDWSLMTPLATLNVPAGSISTAVVHGTSYAAGLVAGVAALYRQANPSANAAAVQTAVIQAAIPALDAAGLKSSPNRLLNTRGLSLPGASGGVKPPAYDSSLVQETLTSCVAGGRSLVGRPSALHRTPGQPYSGGYFDFKHYATPAATRRGVYVARIRVESDRRSSFPIFSALNYTDISRPVMHIFAGNPAMQSYQNLASIDGYGTYSSFVTNQDPLPAKNGQGAFWIRPGTYYVLVEGLYVGPPSTSNYYYSGNGRGDEGVFRLDVTDDACSSPANSLQSDGTCQYTDLLTCGRTMLVTSPSNSQGLNHTALFAKAGIPTTSITASYVPRDLVVRVQIPIGSSPPAFSFSVAFMFANQYPPPPPPPNAWLPTGQILVLDNCPSSSNAHVLFYLELNGQSQYNNGNGGSQNINFPQSRDLLPGTYYVVLLMNAFNSYTRAPDTGPVSSYYSTTVSFTSSAVDTYNYCINGVVPPSAPSCGANVLSGSVPYCGAARSSLFGKDSVFGQAGSTAVFQLTALQFSRRNPYITVCANDLDFVPTLYAYQGCPSDPSSKRLHTSTGCDMTLSTYHAVTVGTPIYIVVEGVLSGDRTGNFSLTVTDADCGGAVAIPGSSSSGGEGAVAPAAQQCFPLSSLTTYYDVRCPPSIALSRLAPVTYGGAVVCGAAMPDLRALLFAEWGPNVSITQTPDVNAPLLPAVTSTSNAAWRAANLPSSGQGTYQVSLSITNVSGRGPRGTCSFPLTVLDTDGPFSRAVCPARSQEVVVQTGQCTAPAPDLSGGLQWDGACMRPVSGAGTLVQSVAPGTPLAVGEKYNVRLYSSEFPNGAACPVLLKVRRAAAPQINFGMASPAEIVGVVGGRPALVPVSLSYTLGDTCSDHAKACRISVHATGDPTAGVDGTLATPEGTLLPLWNQTCAVDLTRVLLSPYIDPSQAGAPGTVARLYAMTLACAYDAGQRLSASWTVPVRRP